MAEAFVFRNKTVGPESAARRTFSRRTWLIVGVMTSAMLLMCTSVAVLQRRFDLTGYFRHSPAAAAAAATEVWDRQSTANATLRKNDALEREQRSSSTHGAAVAKEIKPRELVQAKIKRKARAKSTPRRHEDSSRGTSAHKAPTRRGAPRGRRDGREVVDVDRELEILQRPFAERPKVVEDDASPTGRVDAKKEQSIAGTVETVPKSGAPLASSPGVDSSRASARIEPSTSDFTTDSSGSQEAEGTSSTAPTMSDMPVSSTSSNNFSATPHKGVRMVKKRRKLRRLGTLPASMSSPDSSSTYTVLAGNTSAGTHTVSTGDARAKKEEVTEKEHELNTTSKVATGLSSENPATIKERTSATDVEISDTSSGNMSSNLSQVPSSSPSVNGVIFTTKRGLAETSKDQEPVSKKGTVVGVIGSTPNVDVAGMENSSASEQKSSSAVASSNDETGTSESNTYDSVSGTSNSSLNEVSSSAKSSSQLQTSFTTLIALRSTETAQTPQINDTLNDASLVDVVAGGVNKSAEDVLEKILNKATKDRRNNSMNSTKDRAGTADTSKSVDGGVTWKDGAGNASSSAAVTSVHTRSSSESKESSEVRATTYSTDQNRSTSMGVAERRAFASTSPAASPQPSAAEPSNTQPSAIPSSEKEGLKSTSESRAFVSTSPAASPQSSAAEPSNTQPSTKLSSETEGLTSTSEGTAFVSTSPAASPQPPAAEPSNTQPVPVPSSGKEGLKSTSEGRAFASTSSAAEPSHTQPSAIRSSEKEGSKTETSARELATRWQAREGSPEKLSSSLLESSTPVSTSDNPSEVIGASKDAGPPDEIVPETEAASTSVIRETTTPATTTSTFAYYTGQDEWIPESRRRYMDARGGYSNMRKPELRGKALAAHHVLANNNEPIVPGDHSSHQTTRSADASVGGTSGKLEHHETQARKTSEGIAREQQPTSKVNVKSAMSELYSSLNEAIREERKHDVGQSGEEMLDYGVIPRDVASMSGQNASTVPGLGPYVRNGQSESGKSTQLDQKRGSTTVKMGAHPGSANRSAWWNKTSKANPEPFAINVSEDGGVLAHTFDGSFTKSEQDMPQKVVTVSNRGNDELLSKASDGLTGQRSVSDEIATKPSHAPAARLPIQDNSYSSDPTSTESRARDGVSYTDKHKAKPYTETPPNVLDIGADLPEAESSSGPNQPGMHPLADDHAASPTNGSTNGSIATRYFANGTGVKYGNTRSPQGSGDLGEESMGNGNPTPTRSPRASDASRYSVDADHSGSRSVVTTAGGIVLKTSRPDVRRTGLACVYRKDHAGWVSGNTTYGLDTMPYQYCASVVYCCLGLREDFAIEDHGNHSDFTKLAKVKSDNPGLQTFVVIKADNSSAPSFKRLVSGTMHQDIFNLLAVHWMKTRTIDGVYLYWPQMEDSDGGELVNAFRYLVGSFAKSNLKFGIILPPGTRYFANKSTLKALTEDLDGSYDAVLLSPPEMDESAYTGKLSSPSQALAGEYGKYPGDLAGTVVCPMIPFWGKTFKMKAVLQDSDLTLRPVGRGGARKTSREPGKLAFFEFCRELGNSRFVFPSRENAMIGDEYVMFLTPAALERYLESSRSSHTSWRCLGSWGPEWDDFDGFCGLGRYPLLRTLYEFHKRAVNAAAAFSVSKAGQS